MLVRLPLRCLAVPDLLRTKLEPEIDSEDVAANEELDAAAGLQEGDSKYPLAELLPDLEVCCVRRWAYCVAANVIVHDGNRNAKSST